MYGWYPENDFLNSIIRVCALGSMVDNRRQTALAKTNPIQTPNDWFHHCPTMRKSIVGTNDRGSNSSQPVNSGLTYPMLNIGWTLVFCIANIELNIAWTLAKKLLYQNADSFNPQNQGFAMLNIKKNPSREHATPPPSPGYCGALNTSPKANQKHRRFLVKSAKPHQFCAIPLFLDRLQVDT